MAKEQSPAMDWVTVNRHLQSTGHAVCNVSLMILDADDLDREGHKRLAFMVMSAAREVLRCRRHERAVMAARIRKSRERHPLAKQKKRNRAHG